MLVTRFFFEFESRFNFKVSVYIQRALTEKVMCIVIKLCKILGKILTIKRVNLQNFV